MITDEMDIDNPEWEVPQVTSVDDFELCRALKEKGKPTGKYELLDANKDVKSSVVNWESLFVQFKDSTGKLLPVKVSLPSLLEDDEEEQEQTPSTRKGKRKASPDPAG